MMAPAAGGLVPPPIVSETARERETYTFDDLGISTAALRSPPAAPDKLIPTSVLSSTPDPALTAFAQLGLYRLNATHSIVSLFDRTYQHFVAEAVRCAPLCKDGEQATEGPRVFCGSAIPRSSSICEHVLTDPAEKASIPGNGAHGAVNLPVSVIPNLDLDPRFCYLRDKNRRFYAGVPIRARSGINIGVYCVLDNKPRPAGLTDDQIQFARDISQTIMDYLHAKRSNEWYRREERMVRGMGSFVEGQATLSNWSDCLDNSSFRDIPGVQEGALNKKLQAVPHSQENGDAQGKKSENGGLPPNVNHAPSSRSVSPSKQNAKGSVSSISSSDLLLGDVERVFSKATNIIRESIEVEGVLALDASVRTFGGLVGNEVYEPPILERVPSTDSSSDESQGPLPTSNTEQQYCSIFGFSTSSGSSINGHTPAHGHTVVPERLLQRLLQRYPHGRIFNFEPDGLVSDQSGSEVEDTSSPISPLSVGSLHPYGPDEENNRTENPRRSRSHQDMASCLLKIFPGARSLAFVPLFDGQKRRWFAGGFAWTKTPTRIFTVENELSYLRVFGLAAMAEVGRLNTKAADKTKTDILGSISHELRSPLHGVVGSVELLRNTELDATQENILRTIETSGRTLLDTIDHLLDYSKVNNIVRSASRAERKEDGGPRPRRNTSSMGTLQNPARCVPLDRLVEEVVESVLAGWSYRNMSDANFAAWHSLMQGSPRPSADTESTTTGAGDLPPPYRPTIPHTKNRKAVRIFLDIDHTVDWRFRAHPGAFRRIVLNLFGNSLKFTKDGFIRVTLQQERRHHRRQEQHTNLSDPPQTTKVILVVSDSGKGMSQEYLNTNIFTPFSQEDHFAPGTGLGLSLVRQMVVSLGGTIDVLSQVGQGTTMTVTLPLSPYISSSISGTNPTAGAFSSSSDESSPPTRTSSRLLSAAEDTDDAVFTKNVTDHLAGKRIHLRGFDNILAVREGAFGVEDGKQKTQVQLVESICRGWLKMNVVPPPVCDKEDIREDDYVVCLMKEHNLKSLRESLAADDGGGGGGGVPATCPRVVVCRDSNAMYALGKPGMGGGKGRAADWGVSYIGQPIGPRKLAQALVSSRLQWQKNRSLNDNLGVPGAVANRLNIQNPTVEPCPLVPASERRTAVPFLSGTPRPDDPGHEKMAVRPKLSLDTRDVPAISVVPPLTTNGGVVVPPSIKTAMEAVKRNDKLAGLALEERRHKENGTAVCTSQASAVTIPPSHQAACGSVSGASDESKEILIVDDNPINLKILAAYMLKLHHPHIAATNGSEAVALYSQSPERFRCIVTDISMPVMDGLESTRRIREFERANKVGPITVIALTGLSGEEIQQDAFVSGVDLFLTRPLVLKGLERALEVTGHGRGAGGGGGCEGGTGDGGQNGGGQDDGGGCSQGEKVKEATLAREKSLEAGEN